MNRRLFLAASGATVGALTLAGLRRPADAFAVDWDDARYWAFADQVQVRMEPLWKQSTEVYWPSQSMLQANMLLTHATAALVGHGGPARQDRRAAALVRQLCAEPWWAERDAPPGDQRHLPGWIDGGIQHLVVDAEIAHGLAIAHRASAALGLDAATVALIADRLTRAAHGPYWRWPTIRLNQINWYCRMYVAAASVGGSGDLLVDLMRQLHRFVDQAKRARDGHSVANFGPGYRFHYLPDGEPGNPFNLDSPEYACTVLGFLGAYAEARKLGMGQLDGGRAKLIQAWVGRALCGYWTHSGYLNWDTGLGFKRWHQVKKLGLAQSALLGIVACPELRPPGGYGAWAKHMLDEGFAFFGRQIERTPGAGLPPANMFGVPTEGENPYSQGLAAARMQANAAKAVLLSLGKARTKQPPPLYAYDPDVGRLAVTTPHYNTAVVPCSRKAFPYGGLDVARLFDGKQDPAGNIGGVPPAAFGMTVRDAGGKVLLSSQRALAERRGVKPLRLTKAPRGTAARLAAYPSAPYAGPFTDLRAEGVVRWKGIELTVSHRFTRRWIETRWVMRKSGDGRASTEALFPSTGPGAGVTAVMRGGERRVLAVGAQVRLDRIAYFHVRSERAGYVVVVRSAPAGAVAELAPVGRQSSAPHAGPSLRLRLANRARRRRVQLIARYAPVGDADEAASLAHLLR